jgi:hypothetical protein
MPYALFDEDTKISKTYPTAEDVWKQAEDTGLVVDNASEEEAAAPKPVLDNGYEIKPCEAEPGEDPKRNQQEASLQIAPASGTSSPV